MKFLFFTDGMNMDGEIWGVYWQEPDQVVGEVLDPKGKRHQKDYPGIVLKVLQKEGGNAVESFAIDLPSQKAAIAFLGKKKDLLDKYEQVKL